MVTDIEMGALNQLSSLCKDKLSKDIVDVVQEMMGDLDVDMSSDEVTELVSEHAEQIDNIIQDAIYNDKLPKRQIGDYEILKTFEYGKVEIFLGEKRNAAPDAPDKYVLGNCTFNGLFEKYENCIGCNNYNEIVELFVERVNEQVEKVKEDLAKFPYDRTVIGKEACDSISGVDLKGKVVVVDSDYIKREYAGADKQLCLAAGGFGCSPEGSGTKVYCVNLYTGKEVEWRRYELLGAIKPECMPEWAKEKLAEIEKAKSVDGIIKNATVESEKTDTGSAGKGDIIKE